MRKVPKFCSAAGLMFALRFAACPGHAHGNSRNSQPVRLSISLNFARGWHSATLLPDGRVLVLGGVDASGNVAALAEVFDPTTQTFNVVATPGPAPGAYHTATLLTDGTMLVAGGVGSEKGTCRPPTAMGCGDPTGPW